MTPDAGSKLPKLLVNTALIPRIVEISVSMIKSLFGLFSDGRI